MYDGATELSVLLGSGRSRQHATAKDGTKEQKRAAYESKNAATSRQLHNASNNAYNHMETHPSGGDVIKQFVFGGMDGILTCYAVIAGAAGGAVPPHIILILSMSTIFADAIAMGVGDYLSSKAERDFVRAEADRERWEMDNYREGEIAEMVDLFELRGMDRADAVSVVTTMAWYDEFFVRLMVTEELGLQPPVDDSTLTTNAVAMFSAFCGFGVLPLLPYAAALMWWDVTIALSVPHHHPSVHTGTGATEVAVLHSNSTTDITSGADAMDGHTPVAGLFLASTMVTAMALFALGAAKSRYSTLSWYASGAETLGLGGICAVAAYAIGYFVSSVLG